MSRLVTSRLRLDEALDEVVRAAHGLLGRGVVRLWILEPDGSELILGASAGDTRPEQLQIRALPADQSLVGQIALSGEILQVEDVLADTRWINREATAEADLHAFLGVPLIAAGEPLGALSILAREPGAFPEDEVELMRAFAAQAAIAISNARLYDHAERRARRLAAWSAASRVVTSSLDLPEVLGAVVRSAKEVLDVDIARLWTVDDVTGELCLIAASDEAVARRGWITRMAVEGSLLGTVLTSGEVFQTADVSGHPLLRNRRYVRAEGLRGYIAVPIQVRDRPFGVLVLFARARRIFHADEVDVLRSLGSHAAIAIDNARLYELQTRQAARLLALHGVAVSILSTVRNEDLLRRVVEHATALTRAECGVIYLLDPSGESLRPAEGFHSGAPHHSHVIVLPSEGVAGRAFGDRRVYRVNDYQSHPWATPAATIDGVQAIMAAPLLTVDEPLGAIAVTSHVVGHRFEAEDEVVLELLAAQAAVGIQNMRMFDAVGQIEGLRELDRLKTEFLSTVSHELRTPLSYIHGYAELLMTRRFDGDEVLDMAREIHRGSSSMVRLVDDLLDISRIESGQLALHLTPTRVEDVLRSAAGVFGVQSPRHGVKIDLSPEPLPPLLIDPERLRQIISNLLTNAIQYSPNGGEVRVSASQRSDAIRVEVTDRGIGIPREELGRVFERFYRGPQALISAHRGSGLGLAIVKHLVEAHGGTVGVESRVGTGSTFWFTLPIRPPSRAGAPTIRG